MTEEKIKTPSNVQGKYYVLYDYCTSCQICVDDAPNNFKFDENSFAYVFKQPETDEEEAQCDDVFRTCPTEAICNDG